MLAEQRRWTVPESPSSSQGWVVRHVWDRKANHATPECMQCIRCGWMGSQ